MAVDDLRGVSAVPVQRGVRPSLMRRLRAAMRSTPDGVSSGRLRRLGDACVVLADARTIVERGWVQETWYAGCPDPGGTAPAAAAAVRPPDEVRGACLVGAVVHAARQRQAGGDDVEAGPALDVLWEAWQDSRGLRSVTGLSGRAVSREVRAARVRDLTRWNDRPERTREEVLGLLDVAATLAIMDAMRTPAPAAVSSR
jgi:hypothetical protein